MLQPTLIIIANFFPRHSAFSGPQPMLSYPLVIFRAGCKSPPAVILLSCKKAREPASVEAGRFGEKPKPTVKVRMKEDSDCCPLFQDDKPLFG